MADHTTQCKITLGGNLAGTIIYREAVLPLLLSDSKILIAEEENRIRIAFSGLCSFPFRSLQIEDDINDSNCKWDVRINNVISHLPAPALDDISGTGKYREFVLSETLINIVNTLAGVVTC